MAPVFRQLWEYRVKHTRVAWHGSFLFFWTARWVDRSHLIGDLGRRRDSCIFTRDWVEDLRPRRTFAFHTRLHSCRPCIFALPAGCRSAERQLAHRWPGAGHAAGVVGLRASPPCPFRVTRSHMAFGESWKCIFWSLRGRGDLIEAHRSAPRVLWSQRVRHHGHMTVGQ